jgi:hypothetical protein
MKNVITKVTEGTMAGSVFFGHAEILIGDRDLVKFTVCNHLKPGKEYEFRAIGKARAGFNTIFDFKAKPEHLWSRISKDTTCIQVKEKTKSIGDQWYHIYISKGQKWETIDVTLLDTATVGDIHQSAPKMASYRTWERTNAKTWADLSFCMNKASK